jgi:DNA-binding NarL/FixJ family response regulator
VRILIADDHAIVRAGIKDLCGSAAGMEVVAEAGDGRSAIELAIELKPDIAILDYSLPLANGAEVARAIREGSPDTNVLLYTMHDSDAVVTEALRSGVRGYVLKDSPNSLLLDAINAVAEQRLFFSEGVSTRLVHTFSAEAPHGDVLLSSRERSVLQLIAEGYSNKQIGKLLMLSLKTVESHRASTMRKLHARSSADLVRYAIRHSLIES